MIIKLIRDPKHSRSVETRIQALTDYVVAPENTNAAEKCVYAASRGLLAETLAGKQAEMTALALAPTRGSSPVMHWLMSWQPGEQPNEHDVEHAVDVLLAELGVSGHQVLYGLHADTDHWHVHIVLNRVDPATERPTRINGGFELEAGHRAIARIEAEQGWAKETNARYTLIGDQIVRTGWEAPPEPGSQTARDTELRKGQMSVERQVQQVLQRVVPQVKTWAAFHMALAVEGATYKREGNGAVIMLDGVAVKASAAWRKASLPRLVKLFGPFEPSVLGQEEISTGLGKEDVAPDWRLPEPPVMKISGAGHNGVGLYVPGFHLSLRNGAAYYSRGDGRRAEIVDRGHHVEVINWRDPDVLRAAVALAARKFPNGITIEGSDEFKQLAAREAARQGIPVKNPELIKVVDEELGRIKRRDKRNRDAPLDFAAFDRFQRALGFERCEIVEWQKRRPVPTATSPQAAGIAVDHVPEALEQTRGEQAPIGSIGLVPQSAAHHVLVLEGLGQGQAKKLQELGYRICTVARSGDSYCLTLLVARAGVKATTSDLEELSRRLRAEIGAEAAGYASHHPIPRSIRTDSSELFPALRASRAPTPCPKLAQMLDDIRNEATKREAALAGIGLPKISILARAKPKSRERWEGGIDPRYLECLTGARAQLGYGNVHGSRIDAEVAIRLRAEDLARDQIEAIIARAAAGRGQHPDFVSLSEYARRAADAAFSGKGDKLLELVPRTPHVRPASHNIPGKNGRSQAERVKAQRKMARLNRERERASHMRSLVQRPVGMSRDAQKWSDFICLATPQTQVGQAPDVGRAPPAKAASLDKREITHTNQSMLHLPNEDAPAVGAEKLRTPASSSGSVNTQPPPQQGSEIAPAFNPRAQVGQAPDVGRAPTAEEASPDKRDSTHTSQTMLHPPNINAPAAGAEKLHTPASPSGSVSTPPPTQKGSEVAPASNPRAQVGQAPDVGRAPLEKGVSPDKRDSTQTSKTMLHPPNIAAPAASAEKLRTPASPSEPVRTPPLPRQGSEVAPPSNPRTQVSHAPAIGRSAAIASASQNGLNTPPANRRELPPSPEQAPGIATENPRSAPSTTGPSPNQKSEAGITMATHPAESASPPQSKPRPPAAEPKEEPKRIQAPQFSASTMAFMQYARAPETAVEFDFAVNRHEKWRWEWLSDEYADLLAWTLHWKEERRLGQINPKGKEVLSSMEDHLDPLLQLAETMDRGSSDVHFKALMERGSKVPAPKIFKWLKSKDQSAPSAPAPQRSGRPDTGRGR